METVIRKPNREKPNFLRKNAGEFAVMQENFLLNIVIFLQ